MRRSLASAVVSAVLIACGGGGGGHGPDATDAPFVLGPTAGRFDVVPDRLFEGFVDLDDERDLVLAGTPAGTGQGPSPFAVQAAFGDGSGRFTYGFPSVGGTDRDVTAPSPVVGRFDLDPFLDVVVFRDDGVQTFALVFHGEGDGTFAPWVAAPVALGTHATSATVAEMNGDAYDDLVVGDHGVGIVVLLATGPDAFGPPLVDFLPVVSFFAAVTTADVDADGSPDVLAMQQSGRISILLNDGTGNLDLTTSFSTDGSATEMIASSPQWPEFVAVFSTVPAPQVSIYPRDVNNSFVLSTSQRVDLDDGFTQCVAMVPVRRDLRAEPDVAVIAVHPGTGELRLYLVRHGTPSQYAVRLPVGRGAPIRVVAGDFDGDDREDLALLTYGAEADGRPFVELETLRSTGQ